MGDFGQLLQLADNLLGNAIRYGCADKAFEQLAITLQSLVKARGGMANCHVSMKETTQFVPGLRTVGFGDAQECPPKQARADLRVVA